MSDANIKIPVDLTNPGQFFACCGLLELADRLWPGAEGWFEPRQFCMRSDEQDCSLKSLFDKLHKAEVTSLDRDDDSAPPLSLPSFRDLRLDWWKKIEAAKGQAVDIGTTKSLMTWSGSQKGPRIFRLFQETLSGADLSDPFNQMLAVCDPNASNPDKAISPFYFDSRRDGMSLDIGFSPDEQQMSVGCSPSVEVLALIGIQRCRPAIDEQTTPRSFVYHAWTVPLPPIVASLAAQGAVPVNLVAAFRFTKPSRGGDYLTMFSRAKRERSKNV
jgi:hypothetical protein